MGISPTPRPVVRVAKTMGMQLATWRKLQRLTAEEVSARADITRGTLRKIEHGDPSVSFEKVLRVAHALGVEEMAETALDPYATDLGRLRSDEALPHRVRR